MSEGWQPIETAPKDAEVLVVCALGVCAAKCGAYDGWHLCTGGREPMTLHDDRYSVEPTYWMPLPEPPR